MQRVEAIVDANLADLVLRLGGTIALSHWPIVDLSAARDLSAACAGAPMPAARIV